MTKRTIALLISLTMLLNGLFMPVFATQPQIQKAFADSVNQIIVTFANPLTELANPYVITPTGEIISVTATSKNDSTYIFTLPVDLNVYELYMVGADDVNPQVVEMRGILDNLYYANNDLGLTYSTDASTFKVWAPTAVSVELAIYDNAGSYNSDGKVTIHTDGAESLMEVDRTTGVWSITMTGDLKNNYYMYKVTFADGTQNYAVDPYAIAVSANGQRSAIIDLEETNTAAFKNDVKPQLLDISDAVIYELHVRDFSIDPDAGFENRGEYLAFTETGLTIGENNVSIGIDHLVELGITHLHLLPVYDYASVDEISYVGQFNWGYDPQNYNVPEGSYSSNPHNPITRIQEFKDMVAALHANGIRVVMDVVYNHTYSVEDGPFEKIVPNYYYRTHDNGDYANGSGCGNEVASERPMVRKFIKDSVTYWADEYNLDGFRFDLMGLIDIQTMQEITHELLTEVDPTMLIYGEPWQAGGSILPSELQTLKGSQKGESFAVFNDNIRGAIKGDSDTSVAGFATGEPGNEADLIEGVMGAINTIATHPTEVISYVTAHDNLNLWDKVIFSQGLTQEEGFVKILDGKMLDGGSVEAAVANATIHHDIDLDNVFANETVRRTVLSNGIVLTSQGIPFLHAGEELLRSKYGDHNSYMSPDAINMIRWELKDKFVDVSNYYQGLIELRKAHPAFSMETAQLVTAHFTTLQQEDNIVAFSLGEHANGDSYKNIVVIYNANNEAKDVALPHAADWNVVVDDTKAGTAILETLSNASSICVAPLSMTVLYDEESAYEQIPTTIILPQETLGLGVNNSYIVNVVVQDQFGHNMLATVEAIVNDDIVSVDDNKIIANEVGETTLTFKCAEAVAMLEVVVVEQLIPTTLTISQNQTVHTGFDITITAEVNDQFNRAIANPTIDWQSLNADIASVTPAGKVTGHLDGVATIIANVGELSATTDVIVAPYENRYIVVEYYRPEQDYADWNLWVWNTGVMDGEINFTEDLDGMKIAYIEIGPTAESVGFIVRTQDWVKDIDADRFVNTTETITTIRVNQGEAEFEIIK